VSLRTFVLAALLLLAACSKVTQENFSKIQEGMSEQEAPINVGFLFASSPEMIT